MGDKTGIEWTDATWNPTTGCREVSPGCKNCYARRIWKRPYPKREFHDVQCHPERLEQPLRWKKPRRIFVNSMSDLFHEDVPDEFIDKVFKRMQTARQHQYQVLTKRPERMRQFLTDRVSVPWGGFSFPEPHGKHIHLGVSVEDQPTADERIPILLQTPAAVRFVSYEPALGPIDLKLTPHPSPLTPRLDWLIVGGESGPGARPMQQDWARSVRDQCRVANVPFFFKQWGEYLPVGQNLPGFGKIHGGTACTPGRMKLHYGGTPGQPPKHAFAERGVDFASTADGRLTFRVGKKAAGAVLDGREWKEFPR